MIYYTAYRDKNGKVQQLDPYHNLFDAKKALIDLQLNYYQCGRDDIADSLFIDKVEEPQYKENTEQ